MEPVSSGPVPASASASDAAGEGSEEGGGGGGGGGGGARRHRAADQLYVGGIKKPKRERLGCTTAKERISKMPPSVAGKRSSIYRGVTRHRWTGRYEAHLWDKSTWNQNQNKKGKQVYLGAYDDEEAAARAYDLAALKYWGVGTLINFPVSDYSRDLEEMQLISKEDYLISLRRKSSAFSRGFPKFRGAGRHFQNSGLETTLGQIIGNSMNEKRYVNVLGAERKIDLTCYIRWWSPMKTHQTYSSGRCLDEKLANPEDATRELQALECQKQPTEPYQLPSLGVPCEMKPQTSAVSACNILSKSDAFRNYQQKLSESHDIKQEIPHSNPSYSDHGGIGSATVPLGLGGFSTQKRTLYPSTSLATAVSKSTWNSMDAGTAPNFWAGLAPQTALPTRKEETSYSYSCEE